MLNNVSGTLITIITTQNGNAVKPQTAKPHCLVYFSTPTHCSRLPCPDVHRQMELAGMQ